MRVCFDFASMSHVGGWVEQFSTLGRDYQREHSGQYQGPVLVQLPSLNNEFIYTNVQNSVDTQRNMIFVLHNRNLRKRNFTLESA